MAARMLEARAGATVGPGLGLGETRGPVCAFAGRLHWEF